ncbi:MAG: nuclear transport factor 2 family protein, partial [Mesorhizobium sp.]
DFPSNDMLMQETFAVANDQITASSQAAIAENCDGY